MGGGTIPTFDTSAGGRNHLRVIAVKERGWLFVNSEFVSALDLLDVTRAGGVAVITGEFTGSQLAGAITRFENFRGDRLSRRYGPADGKLEKEPGFGGWHRYSVPFREGLISHHTPASGIGCLRISRPRSRISGSRHPGARHCTEPAPDDFRVRCQVFTSVEARSPGRGSSGGPQVLCAGVWKAVALFPAFDFVLRPPAGRPLRLSAFQDAAGSVAQSSLTPASSSWFLYRMRSEVLLANLAKS